MAALPKMVDGVGDLLVGTINQLEDEDNTVLSTVQMEDLLQTTHFMRTSSKHMSGVFVDDEGRTRIIRLLAQVSEDVDLMGSLKFAEGNELSMTKITNAKWKVVVKVPGDCPLEAEYTAKLFNQALFFSRLQATHELMLTNVNEKADLWGFVKNRFETEFLLTGCVQPMFYKFKSTDEETLLSLQTAIENAKNGETVNNNSRLRLLDTLDTFPDPTDKFKKISEDMRKQLVLNVDSEVYDSTATRIHPYRYPEVFAKDVWCLLDVTLKYIDMSDVKRPSRTYQLNIVRAQALHESKYRRHGSFMQRVAGVKRGAPAELDISVRKPLPAISRPFKLKIVENPDGTRTAAVTTATYRSQGSTREHVFASSSSTASSSISGDGKSDNTVASTSDTFIIPERIMDLEDDEVPDDMDEDSSMIQSIEE